MWDRLSHWLANNHSNSAIITLLLFIELHVVCILLNVDLRYTLCTNYQAPNIITQIKNVEFYRQNYLQHIKNQKLIKKSSQNSYSKFIREKPDKAKTCAVNDF